jgi:lipoate-protein ligase A
VIRDGVPVIRRFSGGGTVIVDDGTVFVTLICRGDAVPVPKLYPRPIMDWTETLYVPAFRSVPGFQLREHGKLQ